MMNMLDEFNGNPTLAMVIATAILIVGAVLLLGLAVWIRSRDERSKTDRS